MWGVIGGHAVGVRCDVGRDVVSVGSRGLVGVMWSAVGVRMGGDMGVWGRSGQVGGGGHCRGRTGDGGSGGGRARWGGGGGGGCGGRWGWCGLSVWGGGGSWVWVSSGGQGGAAVQGGVSGQPVGVAGEVGLLGGRWEGGSPGTCGGEVVWCGRGSGRCGGDVVRLWGAGAMWGWGHCGGPGEVVMGGRLWGSGVCGGRCGQLWWVPGDVGVDVVSCVRSGQCGGDGCCVSQLVGVRGAMWGVIVVRCGGGRVPGGDDGAVGVRARWGLMGLLWGSGQSGGDVSACGGSGDVGVIWSAVGVPGDDLGDVVSLWVGAMWGDVVSCGGPGQCGGDVVAVGVPAMWGVMVVSLGVGNVGVRWSAVGVAGTCGGDVGQCGGRRGCGGDVSAVGVGQWWG
uniref:Uncharacterized protein n=1 Tax=Knipowitschia caucasica TaxID=637954 RepID=A0AAV2L0W9_KNICA